MDTFMLLRCESKRVYYAGSGDFKETYNIKCRMRCELQATAHGIEEPLPRAITYFGSRKLLLVMYGDSGIK
jgi:hypothetical protein